MTKLIFQREEWSYIRHIIMPMWERHYQEITKDKDRVPLDPNWPQYDAMDASGALHILTARFSGGKLAGYVFSLIGPHLHYRSTKCAFFDLYWLDHEARKGWNGVKLFVEAEKHLKGIGVQKIYGQTKVWQDVSPIFQRLGWVESERAFTKWIS